jgi:putative endopeptidase
MRRTAALLIFFGLIVVAAGLILFPGRPAQLAQTVSAAEAEEHGFDLADLDTTCKPCQDFFNYVSGGWIKRNPIQPEYASWGRFNALQNHNQEVLRQILEAAAVSKSASGSIEQKIGDFYSACMDTDAIEASGTKPIEPELERIAAIRNLAELQDEVAHLHSQGTRVLFGFGSEQDDKNSQQVIGGARQGGLGLPDRDYYTKDDDKSKQLRDQYVQHIAKMMGLAGDSADTATAEAKTVLAIETKMAENSKTRVERRDPEANYHKMDPAGLRALTPDFSWDTYFRNVGFPNIHEVNVGQPEFFKALDKELKSVPISDWKIYLRWHVIRTAAPALPGKFVDENFNFYGRTLTGAKEIQPRWKRCVNATDRTLGEALGQKYVEKVFPPEAKARAREMVMNLVGALHDDIETLPWMSEPTRKQALAKLAAMNLKIGYPDKWRDYSAYQVARDSYIGNLQRGSVFEFHRELAKIDKPVDRNEWEMSPPTVNAYYDSNMNEIVFPAGILQPPFFDAKADDALNYGGIGAVIGHEMTHGFDDQGAQYDAQGNLHNWWTPEDLKNFKERTACVEKQFDSFVVVDDLHENGKLVLGESIADLGGLTIAHMAFDRTLANKPEPPKMDGFTAEQRFFLSFARIWGTTARPEYERMMTTVDPHPLPRFRAAGALMNTPAFAKAFDCQESDKMAKPADQICKIW